MHEQELDRWHTIFQRFPSHKGSTRIAYECFGGIIKIPRNIMGNRCNIYEHVSTRYPDNLFPIAKAFLLRLSGNIPILYMEKVVPCDWSFTRNYKREHEWVSLIDGYQIGWNRKQEVVAYDYGGAFSAILDMPERKRLAAKLIQKFT